MTPHYGGCTMGYADSIRGAVRDRNVIRVMREVKANSSLLPSSFNDCLAMSLQFRDAGVVTHIAMCHSDIAAEGGWLDTLWGEMLLAGADLISAVVPIKDKSGHTSTAIGSVADRWEVRRRLSLAECAKLPETFGRIQVCRDDEVLLVNTGLWLADLRRPWWDDFAFNLHSRIVKPSPGVYAVENRSEDWEMSHHLHGHGARVAVTRKVKLRHEGINWWKNY